MSEVVLVTGFPSYLAVRLARKVLESDADVVLLAKDKARAEAEAFAAGYPGRVTALVGEVSDMDLGLAGSEVSELAATVTTIHHAAGMYSVGVDKSLAQRVNVEGTRGIVEFAGECRRLRRLCHYSTAFVSGRRKGVILEEDLDEGQPFANFWEETKHEGEKLARAAARRLPVTVFRPGLIVGDSKTGELGELDGPYRLMVMIVEDPHGLGPQIPGRGAAPLHLVPIDFVVDAAYALSLDEKAAGMTFHLTDPSPFPVRTIYQLVAERLGSKKKRPRALIPTGLTRAVLRTPGLDRLARAPLSFLESNAKLMFYNCRNTLARLAGTGIACPTFDSYVAALVSFIVRAPDGGHPDRDDTDDPLDEPSPKAPSTG